MNGRKITIFILGTSLVALGASEAVLRLCGLGDPPLFELHPEIEYKPKHGHYNRFGKTIRINNQGMRTEDIADQKMGPRVILMGDSIVHGTNHLDQIETIPAQLEQRLNASLKENKLRVLPIAAPSWGPMNQLAYLEHHGTFQADLLVWIISSHDLRDAPTKSYASKLPQKTPMLALTDALNVYLQKRHHSEPDKNAETLTLRAIDLIFEKLEQASIPTIVFLLKTTTEQAEGISQDGSTLLARFEARGQTAKTLALSLEKGEYMDALHPSSNGAQSIAEQIADDPDINQLIVDFPNET